MSKLKDIFYPPFSETDAFALLISILIPFLLKPAYLTSLIYSLENLNRPDTSVIMVIIFVFWTFLVIKNVLIKKVASASDKYHMAIIFYFIVGTLTLFTSMEFLLKPVASVENLSFLEVINSVIVAFLFIKSLLSVAVLRAAKSNENMFIDRVKNDQAGIIDLAVLALSASLIYVLFGSDYPLLVSILLIYFYSSSIANIYKRVSIKK